jgi:hypothetical protein
MSLENGISSPQWEDVPSARVEAAPLVQAPSKGRATRSGVIGTVLVLLELGLELGVSLAYFFAFMRGLEVLLVLASLHFASCLIRSATHFLHVTSDGVVADSPAEPRFDARSSPEQTAGGYGTVSRGTQSVKDRSRSV